MLPTGYYLAGGAIAVAVSFLALAAMPPLRPSRRRTLGSLRDRREVSSWIGFCLFAALVAAGFWGSRDPLSNPLPLTVWTLVWVGLTLVQGLLGNLWAWINPWYGPWRAAARLASGTSLDVSGQAPCPPDLQPGVYRLPPEEGYAPALLLFLAFAWFELVYPAPDDPARLATAAAAYWTFSFVAMLLFGYADWTRRGEFLSVFFRVISRFGVLQTGLRGQRRRVSLGWPGAKLRRAKALPLSGVLFILLALSSVSFDGLSKTFFWLGSAGINPLEFPGRTALMGINGTGLVLAFATLSSAFLLCVWLGERLAGGPNAFRAAAGLLVWSIVPIALAYHFAHYLTALLVNGQYAVAALSNPFSLGWDLFGTAGMNVEAGLVMGHDAAWLLWNAQAAAIVAGHALAVLVAHRLAARLHPGRREATLSQLPLTVLMVVYTLFGLWLLSTPTVG